MFLEPLDLFSPGKKNGLINRDLVVHPMISSAVGHGFESRKSLEMPLSSLLGTDFLAWLICLVGARAIFLTLLRCQVLLKVS